MTYTRKDIISAIERTIKWLRDNPDKHLRNACMAETLHKREVHPLDPKATCFCALGRLVKELGPCFEHSSLGYSEADNALKLVNASYIEVYRANDVNNPEHVFTVLEKLVH